MDAVLSVHQQDDSSKTEQNGIKFDMVKKAEQQKRLSSKMDWIQARVEKEKVQKIIVPIHPYGRSSWSVAQNVFCCFLYDCNRKQHSFLPSDGTLSKANCKNSLWERIPEVMFSVLSLTCFNVVAMILCYCF